MEKKNLVVLVATVIVIVALGVVLLLSSDSGLTMMKTIYNYVQNGGEGGGGGSGGSGCTGDENFTGTMPGYIKLAEATAMPTGPEYYMEFHVDTPEEISDLRIVNRGPGKYKIGSMGIRVYVENGEDITFDRNGECYREKNTFWGETASFSGNPKITGLVVYGSKLAEGNVILEAWGALAQ